MKIFSNTANCYLGLGSDRKVIGGAGGDNIVSDRFGRLMPAASKPTLPVFKFSLILMALVMSACVSTPKVAEETFQLAWPAPPENPRFMYKRTFQASTDIVKETASERFKRMATGASASGNTIGKPYGVVARDDVLYVGDTQNRRVSVFNVKKNTYAEIGTDGPGALAKPLGMALDKQGKLYVVDGTAKRVVIYGTDGKYIGAVGGRDFLVRPTGIAVNDEGSRIYVVDTGGVGSDQHQVIVFSPDGKVLFKIGKRGEKEGEFNLPNNATIARDGTLYVVDGGNFRVQAFTPDGKFLFKIGAVGKRSGQFARPKGISTDADGNIYVSDAAFGNVQIFNAKGQLLMWIGERNTGPGPGRYLLPSGVAVDSANGKLYFADQFFKKVDVYDPVKGGKLPAPAPGS